MNKINRLFQDNTDRKLHSLYFCAGAPTVDMVPQVLLTLQRRGIDMVEVGIPFSDPLADGPVIQAAGTVALRNGITLDKIFSQIDSITCSAFSLASLRKNSACRRSSAGSPVRRVVPAIGSI